MENDISNIILEERIKNSLYQKAPEGFTDKLLKEIQINEEFAKEDKKTGKALKYFSLITFSFILTFGTLLLYVITGQYGEVKNNEESILQKIPEFFNGLFTGILDIFGFTLTNMGFIYLIVILVLIFGFSLSDKYIFKKQPNQF